MNLKHLSDKDLLSETERLVAREREILTDVLHHLREVERRRLFSSLKYSSLFQYAVKELKYSEDQAYRRINAMRTMRDLPELEEKLSSGALTLSTLCLAQSFIKQGKKKLSKCEKIEVFNLVEHQSSREAERTVALLAARQNGETNLSSGQSIELKLIASPELVEKIDRLKGLIAHSHPNIALGELVEKLCELGLEKWHPARQKTRTVLKPQPETSPATSKNSCVIMSAGQSRRNNRVISVSLKREIWKESGGHCQNCGSIYALQVDHIQPIAKGGSSTADNLRVLCRPCNQRAAIEQLGLVKMMTYLE